MLKILGKWGVLPILVAWSGGQAVASSHAGSLLDLSLEQLLTVEINTASLNGATLANIASWVTVLNENSWRKTGARRTFDALAFQPATQVMPNVAGGEMVVIRGYTRTTSNRGMALLWDDIPLTDFARGGPSTNLPNINLFALSSIEYTQGPGSALYGSDAFHGVVGLHSFDVHNGDAAATLMTGSDGYYDGGVREGIELGNGIYGGVALAANGQASQHQDYVLENASGEAVLSADRPNRYDTGTAMLTLASDPADATSWQMNYYHHRYDAIGFVGLGSRFAPAPDQGDESSELQMGRLSVTHRFGPRRSLELRGYYWDLGNEVALNVALGGGAVLATQNQVYDQYRFGGMATYRDEISALDTRWALAIGHTAMAVYDSFGKLQFATGAVLRQGPDSLDGVERKIDSVMFEADTALMDDTWHLVWGARQDDYSDFGRQTSPRAGLIYHPAPGHSLKLLYSEAFRAPTANELFGSSSLALGNPDLNPETNRTTELIWLHQTDTATTQVSLFEGHWRDGIVTVTDAGTVTTQYQNQERNHTQGITASQVVQLDPWLLDVNASWVQSHNESLNKDYGAFPRYILNLGVGYQAENLRTDFYLQQRIMLDVDAEVQGHSGSTNATLPHYWRTDFTATWHADKALELMLVARNLFDRNNQFPSITSNGGVEDERFSLSAGVRYLFQ